MSKTYIGFGVASLLVLGVIFYGFAELKANPYMSPMDEARAKSRDARRISDIHQIQTALELYYNDCGSYPPKLTDLTAGCPNSTSTHGSYVYLSAIPTNPTPGGSDYVYSSQSPHSTYTITFTTELDSNLGSKGLHTGDPKGLR